MSRLKKYRSIIIPGLLAILFISIGLVFDKGLSPNREQPFKLRSFENTLHKKQELIKSAISEELAANRMTVNLFDTEIDHSNLSSEGLFILNYYRDSLIFWSDNHAAFDRSFRKSSYSNKLIHLPNGWYLADVHSENDHKVVGLIQIREEFSYENRYLQNEFTKDFFIAPELEITPEKEENIISIHDKNDSFLFGLRHEGVLPYSRGNVLCCILFNLLGLLSILILLSKALRIIKISHSKLGLHFICLLGLYVGIIFGRFPRALFYLDLFSPADFAVSDWLPSLGAFTFATLLIVSWVLFFIRNFSLRNLTNESRKKKIAILFFLGLIGISFFGLVFHLGHLSVLGSNLSVGVIKEFSFNFNNLLYTLNIGLLNVAGLFMAIKIGVEAKDFLNLKWTYLIMLLSISFGWTTFSFFTNFTDLLVPFLFLIFIFTSMQIKREHVYTYRFSFLALFVLLLTIAGSIFFTGKILERNRKIQHLLAENIASEHDPAAEMQLMEIESKIEKDTLLPRLVHGQFGRLNRYMRQNYFNNHLSNYDLQITLCSREDSVLVQPENEYFHCYSFFSEMMEIEGMPLPGNVFYFMDKRNARVSYLGQKNFPAIKNKRSICMYMEISSKPVHEGLGFPELLMDERLRYFKKLANLSYAKYSYGNLVNRQGSFNYNLTAHAYPIIEDEFSIAIWDDYDHFIYNMGEGNMVVVSTPHFGWLKLLKAFPFIFSFLFILVLILSLRFFFPEGFKRWSFGFRFKFQLAIVSMLLLSLIIVAIGVIWYNVSDHKNKGQEELQSTLTSVSVALERQLMPTDLENRNFITDMLVELSEVFWVDINLYDLNGKLIASSRPEIFIKGLVAPQMNTAAFMEMNYNHRSKFLHEEQIGLLNYFSAYVPLMDIDGNVLAYLNLPYFTRQDKIRKEIIGFIVSFLNLYVFMALISVFIAMIISNRITSPLLTIQEKIRNVHFGKANEKIDYFQEDEIGDLVKEYNKKVDELAESAQLLAQSERESAWREMARQIAHEIKNPLTPMKLNIQYLQRAKTEKRPEYEDFFYKVTQTLIEQIDLLSSIASSFSDFANISKAKIEKVNLVNILNETQNLFQTIKGVSVTFYSNHDEVFVNGDREQLSRVLINLVKNGIQAIPENKEGKVDINLNTECKKAIISVRDNGVGISKEAREKLFTPNFTTKTSGMGLGLAMVKSIVESIKGKISYTSTKHRGTTFYVEIPLYKQKPDQN